MTIKRTLLIVLASTLALVGCSSSDDDKYRSNSIPVTVTAGQQDIADALIRSSKVLVTGLKDESNEGLLNYQSFYTQANGTANVAVLFDNPSKMQLFELVSLSAEEDINQKASVSRCQWVDGCGNKKFGDNIKPNNQWQSVVFDLRKDERVTVTPLTHLASALAYQYAYAETPEDDNNQPTGQREWQETGYYSPYSIEQAIDQVSKLLGLRNVQTNFAADLTRINSLNTENQKSATNSIRYGALLAAWAKLQEDDPSFTQKATEEFLEFLANQAQIMQKNANQEQAFVLTLDQLYSAAKENLESLVVHSASVESLVNDVITQFEKDIDALKAGELTEQAPASIKELFGDTAFSEYELGVSQAKAFVNDLQEQSKYFFGDEYDGLINTYLDEQKAFFKDNKDNFNAVLKSLKNAESIYIDSYNSSACENSSSWDATLWTDCSFSNNVLTLTDKSNKKITLKMKNVAANKQAVDIEMTGELQINDLLFKLEDSATSKSRVRLFYSEETNQVPPSTTDPIGYEYKWASFSFYDTEKKDQEWTGNFSLLYRGVSDPTGNSTEKHFNIDTLRLSSRISDDIGGENKDDKEASSLFIAAQSSTADTYYNPDEKFGKLNGFFTEQPASIQDEPKTDLVSYKLGEETINNQKIKYFDYIVDDPAAQSFRYRFYPDVIRNQNADGQYTVGSNEEITTHKMAICPLSKTEGEWNVDGACSPAQIFNGKRDVQKSINKLWQAGAFSYLELPGEGEYFVEWPARKVATNTDQCFELDKLSKEGQSLDAELVSPAVLGLDKLRINTEIMLKDQPKTLLDLVVKAPRSAEHYNLTAALSHDYTTLSQDQDDIFVGRGNDLDRLIVNYNTDSNFKRMGSFSVYKSGVTLAEKKVNAELMLGLNQSYNQSYKGLPHKYVTASNGGQRICVEKNEPFKGGDINDTLDGDAVLSLTFRGVAYGSIRKENGVWIARFIDGTWTPLVPN